MILLLLSKSKDYFLCQKFKNTVLHVQLWNLKVHKVAALNQAVVWIITTPTRNGLMRTLKK
jgi:hypothetical protein